MNLGAVLIAAGSNTNPMHPSGEITVAQRMIASLQKAGVTMIAVVTGPEDKKMEKQLAFPLHCRETKSRASLDLTQQH